MAEYSVNDFLEIGLVRSGAVSQDDIDKARKIKEEALKYTDNGYYKSLIQEAQQNAEGYLNLLEERFNEILSKAAVIVDNPILQAITSGAAKLLSYATEIVNLLSMLPTDISYVPSFKARCSNLFPSIKEAAKAMWLNMRLQAEEYINAIKELEITSEMLIQMLWIVAEEVYKIADMYCQKYTGFTIQEIVVYCNEGFRMYKSWQKARKEKKRKEQEEKEQEEQEENEDEENEDNEEEDGENPDDEEDFEDEFEDDEDFEDFEDDEDYDEDEDYEDDLEDENGEGDSDEDDLEEDEEDPEPDPTPVVNTGKIEKGNKSKSKFSIDANMDVDKLKANFMAWLYQQADALYNAFLIVNMIDEIKAAVKKFKAIKNMSIENIDDAIEQFEAFMDFLDELGINEANANREITINDFININSIRSDLRALASPQGIIRASNAIGAGTVDFSVKKTTVTHKYKIEVIDEFSGILKIIMYDDPSIKENHADLLSMLKASDLFKNSTCASIVSYAATVFNNGISDENATKLFPAKNKNTPDFTIVFTIEVKEETDEPQSEDVDIMGNINNGINSGNNFVNDNLNKGNDIVNDNINKGEDFVNDNVNKGEDLVNDNINKGVDAATDGVNDNLNTSVGDNVTGNATSQVNSLVNNNADNLANSGTNKVESLTGDITGQINNQVTGTAGNITNSAAGLLGGAGGAGNFLGGLKQGEYYSLDIANKNVRMRDKSPDEHTILPFVGIIYSFISTLFPILKIVGRLISNYRTNKKMVREGMDLQYVISQVGNFINRFKRKDAEPDDEMGGCILGLIPDKQHYSIRSKTTYNKLVGIGVIKDVYKTAIKLTNVDLDLKQTALLIQAIPSCGLSPDIPTELFIQLDDEPDGSMDKMNMFYDDQFGYFVYVDSDKDELNSEIARCFRDDEQPFDYINPVYPYMDEIKPKEPKEKDLLLGFNSLKDIKEHLKKIDYKGSIQEFLGNNGLTVNEISEVLSGKLDKDIKELSDADKEFLNLFNDTLNENVDIVQPDLLKAFDLSKITACDFSKNRDCALPNPTGVQSIDEMSDLINDAMDFVDRTGLQDLDIQNILGSLNLDDHNALLKNIMDEKIKGNHAIIEFATDCVSDDAVEYSWNVIPGQSIDANTFIGTVKQDGDTYPIKSLFNYGTVRERNGQFEHIYAKRCSRHIIIDDFEVGSDIIIEVDELQGFNDAFKHEDDLYNVIKDNLCHSVLPDLILHTDKNKENPDPNAKPYRTLYDEWEKHLENTIDLYIRDTVNFDSSIKPSNVNKVCVKPANKIKANGLDEEKQQAMARHYIDRRKGLLMNTHYWNTPRYGGLISLYKSYKDDRDPCKDNPNGDIAQFMASNYYPSLFQYIDPNNEYAVRYRELLTELIMNHVCIETVDWNDIYSYIKSKYITNDYYHYTIDSKTKEQIEFDPVKKMHDKIGDTTDIGEIQTYLEGERDEIDSGSMQFLTNLYIFYVENKEKAKNKEKPIHKVFRTEVYRKLEDLLKDYGYANINAYNNRKETSHDPLNDLWANVQNDMGLLYTDEPGDIAYLEHHFSTHFTKNVDIYDFYDMVELYFDFQEFKQYEIDNPGEQLESISFEGLTVTGYHKILINECSRLNKFWKDTIEEYDELNKEHSVDAMIADFKTFVSKKYAEWPSPIELVIEGETYQWYLFEQSHSYNYDGNLGNTAWDGTIPDLPGEPSPSISEEEARKMLTDRNLNLPKKVPDVTSHKYWLTYWGIGTLVNCIPSLWSCGLYLPPALFIPGPLLSICLGTIFIKPLDILLVLGIGIRLPMNIKPMIQYVALSDKAKNIIFPITMALEKIKQLFETRIKKLEMGIPNLIQMYINKLEQENKGMVTENKMLERQAEELKAIKFPGFEELRKEIEGKLSGLDVRQHIDRLKDRFEYTKRQRDNYKAAIKEAGNNAAAVDAIKSQYLKPISTDQYVDQLANLAVNKIYNK